MIVHRRTWHNEWRDRWETDGPMVLVRPGRFLQQPVDAATRDRGEHAVGHLPSREEVPAPGSATEQIMRNPGGAINVEAGSIGSN